MREANARECLVRTLGAADPDQWDVVTPLLALRKAISRGRDQGDMIGDKRASRAAREAESLARKLTANYRAQVTALYETVASANLEHADEFITELDARAARIRSEGFEATKSASDFNLVHLKNRRRG